MEFGILSFKYMAFRCIHLLYAETLSVWVWIYLIGRRGLPNPERGRFYRRGSLVTGTHLSVFSTIEGDDIEGILTIQLSHNLLCGNVMWLIGMIPTPVTEPPHPIRLQP